MTKPLLLDLFCGAGGAAVGYHRAGFDVIGVDIKAQPNRPRLADALRAIPASWPVSGEDLEAVGWFLEYRAPAVASRVRALA